MQPAMHVGILGLVGLVHALQHGIGLLRGGRVVEIDQRLAIDLQRQRREILANAGHVIGAVQNRRMHGQPLASSQRSACAIASSRRLSSMIASIASPTKAWISSACASFSGSPRARRYNNRLLSSAPVVAPWPQVTSSAKISSSGLLSASASSDNSSARVIILASVFCAFLRTMMRP